MAQHYGLGRGLSSLIPQKRKSASDAENVISEPREDFNYFGGAPSKNPASENIVLGNSVREVDISFIVPNPHQPRTNFDETKLQELADSIKTHGILQPITVCKNGNQYEIIAGERRFQAARLAGLKKVPVIVRQADQRQKLELAIIENIQRHDLNPVEEAKSYKKLVEEFDISQEEVAHRVGKSRSAVANKLRLLGLPIEIQKALVAEKITEGHAKAILAIDNPEKQRALFELILKNNLTVRQTESKTKEVTVQTHRRSFQIDPRTKQIEDDLSAALGTKVKLSKAGGGGKIVIEYYSEEELGSILNKIK